MTGAGAALPASGMNKKATAGICPSCGQRLPARRGMLEVRVGPPAVYWRGGRRIGLTPQQHVILYHLASAPSGFSPLYSLHLLTGLDAGPKSLHVQICNIRRWFRAQGIAAELKNHPGHGYQLQA